MTLQEHLKRLREATDKVKAYDDGNHPKLLARWVKKFVELTKKIARLQKKGN